MASTVNPNSFAKALAGADAPKRSRLMEIPGATDVFMPAQINPSFDADLFSLSTKQRALVGFVLLFKKLPAGHADHSNRFAQSLKFFSHVEC